MDFSKPVTGDLYTVWSSILIANFTDLGKGLDPASVTITGTPPTNTIRYNGATFRWEKYNGSSWVELNAKASVAYDIRVATADQLNAQSASYYRDASNINAGTLAVARGGTGLATYTVGDLIQASGATTLAVLASIATGNVLLSGGVGAVSSWGKVGLTTHVSGVLPAVNGGTGLSSFAVGDFITAATTTTLQTRTPAQVKTALSLVKADVGLSNVDNTSDAGKPVSTAQQTALDLKANKTLTYNVQNTNYTLVAADNNKVVASDDATGNYNYTINTGVHASGDIITIQNDKTTSGNIVLTRGSGMALLNGVVDANITVGRGGIVTLLFKTGSRVCAVGTEMS